MVAAPPTYEEVMPWLVERVPELRPIYEDDVASFEEVLAYSIFARFMDWFIEGVRSDASTEPLRRFATAVEELMAPRSSGPQPDPRVLELVGIEFIEALVQGAADDVIDRAWSWFGPATRISIQRMRGA